MPPRRTRERSTESPSTTPPRARTRTAPVAGLEGKLNEFLGTISVGLATIGDQYSAEIFAQRGPLLAESYAKLAQQNSHVARVLNKLCEGGAWGGAITATLAISLPIAKHHGLYRGPDPFGMMFAPLEGEFDSKGEWGWTESPVNAEPSANGAGTHVSPDTPDTGPPPGVVTVASVDNSTMRPDAVS